MQAIMNRAIVMAALLSAGCAERAPAQEFELPKQDARQIAKAIISAAHPTATNAALLKFDVTKDKEKKDRYTVSMKIEFYGKISNRRYVGDAELRIQISGTEREVLDLSFADNDPIPVNETNLRKLKTQLNELLNP